MNPSSLSFICPVSSLSKDSIDRVWSSIYCSLLWLCSMSIDLSILQVRCIDRDHYIKIEKNVCWFFCVWLMYVRETSGREEDKTTQNMIAIWRVKMSILGRTEEHNSVTKIVYFSISDFSLLKHPHNDLSVHMLSWMFLGKLRLIAHREPSISLH